MVQQLSLPDQFGIGAAEALRLLEPARVIVIPSEQVLALPRPRDKLETVEILAHEPLPFDPLYIDHGLIHPSALFGEEADIELWNRDGPAPEYGGLILTERYAPEGGEGSGVLGFYCAEESLVYTNGIVCRARRDGENQLRLGHAGPVEDTADIRMADEFTDIATRVLRFLNCINVELIDAPLPRQERRAAERKNSPIAQVVHIRQNQKHKDPETQGKVDWSHRWEVRGHYKHFPLGTKMADADLGKVSWEPKRQEYVRRIWCPPFVKGPPNRPLIPETHIVTTNA